MENNIRNIIELGLMNNNNNSNRIHRPAATIGSEEWLASNIINCAKGAQSAVALMEHYQGKDASTLPHEAFKTACIGLGVWPCRTLGNGNEKPFGVVAGKAFLASEHGDKASRTAEWAVLCTFDTIRIASKRQAESIALAKAKAEEAAAIAAEMDAEPAEPAAPAETALAKVEVAKVKTLTIKETRAALQSIIDNPGDDVVRIINELKGIVALM